LEEVLVSKSELEERKSRTAELEQAVAELTMQMEYQIRLKELHVQVRRVQTGVAGDSSCKMVCRPLFPYPSIQCVLGRQYAEGRVVVGASSVRGKNT
jgi:hypothetical protein